MNKHSYLFSLISASLIWVGCSSDEATDNNAVAPGINDDVIVVDPNQPTDPYFSSDSNQPVDPSSSFSELTEQTGTNPASSDNGQIAPTSGNSQVTSSAVVDPNQQQQQNPITQSSSSVAPAPVSSSSKKATNDASLLPPAGFYSSLTVNPPTATLGGEIRCSFDGSIPTPNSEQFTSAKNITQNTVIRCSEFVNGQAERTSTQTYFINENVNMTVIALTVNHHDMFDSTDGLYATGPLNNNGGGMWDMGGFGNVTDNSNPKCTEPCKQANFWKDTELPVHVEYFENGSSSKTKEWETDAGISIIGNYSRYKPKKSVAIKLDKDDFGEKKIKYSLFKTRSETTKFKSFNLRNNGNRFWTDYFGDAMLTSLMEGTEVDYQRSHQVVVFYNGEYFGIHDMRERLNRSFVETNYGIDSKSINVVKNCSEGAGCQNGWEASGTNGADPSEFIQLVNQITSGNFEGENNQQYEQLKQKMNVVSFAQYMIAEMYIHNGDWPNNNIRAWGGNGNPFKFMIFDVDHGYGFTPGITGFDVQSQNMFQWVLGSATMDNNGGNNNAGDPGANNPGAGMGGFGGMGGMGGFGGMGFGMGGANTTIGNMLKKLLANPEFRRLFINQASILLNDYLTYEKVQSAVQAMRNSIPSSEQQRDEQRWPRNQSNFNWSPDGSDLLTFGRNRTETFKQELAQYFGLSGEINVTISASGNGEILLDGAKLPSKSYSGKFYSNTSFMLTAVPTNGSIFNGWSDGSSENPRLVTPNSGTTITANFK
ncbi:MAG: CotH kinase family protein [Fibrobacter sp.]|nr:CotH kinase family protein [Fibrobacter sp.]